MYCQPLTAWLPRKPVTAELTFTSHSTSSGAGERRRRRRRAGRPRSVEAAHPGHADHGPRAADGPDLRAHLQAFPSEPGRVRGRLRQGVVQANAPRHGADRALPRPGGPRRATPVAGSGTRRRSRADRCAGRRRAQEQDPRIGAVQLPNWSRPLGRPPRRSAAATSAAGPTGRASASRRRRTGR